MKTRTVPDWQFKRTCLELIDEVAEHAISVVVTRRGRPLVQIIPAPEAARRRRLLGTILHQEDDVFTTGEAWEADRG